MLILYEDQGRMNYSTQSLRCYVNPNEGGCINLLKTVYFEISRHRKTKCALLYI